MFFAHMLKDVAGVRRARILSRTGRYFGCLPCVPRFKFDRADGVARTIFVSSGIGRPKQMICQITTIGVQFHRLNRSSGRRPGPCMITHSVAEGQGTGWWLTRPLKRRSMSILAVPMLGMKPPTSDRFSMTESADRILAATTQIVIAWLNGNAIRPAALPGMIRAVHQSLADLGTNRPREELKTARPVQPRPAVDIRKSVFADHLVCLEDGKHVTMLKRHLNTAHGLTPELYRTNGSSG